MSTPRDTDPPVAGRLGQVCRIRYTIRRAIKTVIGVVWYAFLPVLRRAYQPPLIRKRCNYRTEIPLRFIAIVGLKLLLASLIWILFSCWKGKINKFTEVPPNRTIHSLSLESDNDISQVIPIASFSTPYIVSESRPEVLGSIPTGWEVTTISESSENIPKLNVAETSISVGIPFYHLTPKTIVGDRSSAVAILEPTISSNQDTITFGRFLRRQSEEFTECNLQLQEILEKLESIEAQFLQSN